MDRVCGAARRRVLAVGAGHGRLWRAQLGGGAQLRVVGLTADQMLVRFRECSPGKIKEIGAVTRPRRPDSALDRHRLPRAGRAALRRRQRRRRVHHRPDHRRGQPGESSSPSRSAGTLVRRRLQPGRRPPAHRQRHRPEPAPQRDHGRHTTLDAALNNLATSSRGASPPPPTPTTTLDANTGDDALRPRCEPRPDRRSSRRRTTACSPRRASSASTPAPAAGFDVYTTGTGGTLQNRGFAVLSATGVTGFYRVDLLGGQARSIGAFGADVQDIALPLAQ